MYSVSIRNIEKRAVPMMKPATFARRQRPEPEDRRSGTSGSRWRCSQSAKATSRAAEADEDADRPPRAPAPPVALGDAEDEQDEAARDEHGTRDVVALAARVPALGEKHGESDERGDARPGR